MNPPKLHPLDGDKYREQYMNNLTLQAANDQKNLNANLIYKQTGQTPSQPTDMRTTTEKEQDLEGMRTEVRSFIASSGFCNTTNANEVSRILTRTELSFVIQYKLYISTDFKGRGVPTAVFVNYIRKLKQKTEDTQGVEYGLQQATGQAILISAQNISNNLPNATFWNNMGMNLAAVRQDLRHYGDRFDIYFGNIEDEIRQLQALIPTRDDLALLSGIQADRLRDIQQDLNRALADIPTMADISALLNQLNTAAANQDDLRTGAILNELQELLEVSNEQRVELGRIKAEIRAGNAQIVAGQEAAGGSSGRTPTRGALTSKELLEKGESEFEIYLTPSEFDGMHVPDMKTYMRSLERNNRLNGVSSNDIAKATKRADLKALYARATGQGGGGGASSSSPAIITPLTPAKGEESGHGLVRMKGKGLAAPRERNYSKAGKIDGEVIKTKPYKPFGKFVVNHHKLADGILMLRRSSGGALKELPTHRINGNLAHIIKTISAGMTPHIDQIMGLGVKDQEHLHRILHLSHIDNVPVPPPKTDSKKEMDRFEILRGEIMAGNDNKTLVREFKVLLLRFIQEGRIPRREGQEILTDLTAMGF
jgi:hypothetical protein